MTLDRLRAFLEALGSRTHQETRLYLTGGATAVVFGWRTSTVDVDLKLVPDRDDVFRALPDLKEKLEINVEPAAPDDFIPVRPGWEERSRFIARFGRLAVYHYDLYAQALAKIERGHQQDLTDVRMMVDRKLVDAERLVTEFQRIEPLLYRYPAVEPRSFKNAVASFVETARRRSAPDP